MRRRSPLRIAAIVVAGAVAVLGVDELVEPARPAPAPSIPGTVTPVAGTWACAVGDGRDDTNLAVTAARPGILGDPPAGVELEVVEDGAIRRMQPPTLHPGTHVRSVVDGGGDLGVAARWSGGPVAVAREWRLDDEDLPPGTVAGACTRAVAETWVVPGMTTVGGHEARLRLVNPFPGDATIAIGFVTPEGPEDPVALENLTVPGRGTIEVAVNDVMPERGDLSAVVRVSAGRIAVEGYQLTRAEIGDIDGASLLAASTGAAETWTVPWVADGDDVSSWLWVLNLGERPAPVELTLHTEDGGVVPEGLAEVTVAPGQVRRIDLRGTLPDGVPSSAVTVRSDGAPVHVSAATELAPDDVGMTGFAVQLGSPAADDTWVVAGGSTSDRDEELRLVNPGSEPAEVDIALFNGSTTLGPGDLQGLVVAPGALEVIDLVEVLGEVRHWSAVVTATTGDLVVGRLGARSEPAPDDQDDPEEPDDVDDVDDTDTEDEGSDTGDEGDEGAIGRGLHLIAAPGTPSSAWSPIGGGLRAEDAPATVVRLGTSLGIQPEDPLAPPLGNDRPTNGDSDEVDDLDGSGTGVARS